MATLWCNAFFFFTSEDFVEVKEEMLNVWKQMLTIESASMTNAILNVLRTFYAPKTDFEDFFVTDIEKKVLEVMTVKNSKHIFIVSLHYM